MLSPEQHVLAHRNEFDFDSPISIDFDLLVERLKDLKAGYGNLPTEIVMSRTDVSPAVEQKYPSTRSSITDV